MTICIPSCFPPILVPLTQFGSLLILSSTSGRLFVPILSRVSFPTPPLYLPAILQAISILVIWFQLVKLCLFHNAIKPESLCFTGGSCDPQTLVSLCPVSVKKVKKNNGSNYPIDFSYKSYFARVVRMMSIM